MFWRSILLIAGINNILCKARKLRVIDQGIHVNAVWLIKTIASHLEVTIYYTIILKKRCFFTLLTPCR
jgi:hypothetical protein